MGRYGNPNGGSEMANTLTAARTSEILVAMESRPACTCVWKSRNDMTPIRFSKVEDCDYCKITATIEAEVFGEPRDYASQLWYRLNGPVALKGGA